VTCADEVLGRDTVAAAQREHDRGATDRHQERDQDRLGQQMPEPFHDPVADGAGDREDRQLPRRQPIDDLVGLVDVGRNPCPIRLVSQGTLRTHW
jgi:hypothetical protein